MAYAGNEIVHTPAFDAFADRATRFRAAYTNSPICVPARAAWATGRFVHEIGYWDNAMAYDGRAQGWGHVLQEARITVESIGKLHYANEQAPTGFDRQIDPMHIMDGIGQVWGSIRDPLPRKQFAEYLVELAGPGESTYTEYDRRSTATACEWLGSRRDTTEPWVLYVGLVAPHHPYVAPDEFFALYDPEAMPRAKLHPLDGHERHPWVAEYGDMMVGLDMAASEEGRRRCTAAYYGLVSFLDHNVGLILGALDEAGLADDTLVIYTSDHGDMVGSRGLWGKSVMYEESAGIPLLVAGPGVPAGHVCDTPVSLIDGYRTIVETAGLAMPDDGPDRSGNLVALANADDDDMRVAFSEYHAMGAPTAAFLVRRGRYKLHYYVDYPPELFDLEADPDETTNLAEDPAHQNTRISLTQALRDICDPEAVDSAAKAAQAALVEHYGGVEIAEKLGTPGETPVPGVEPYDWGIPRDR